MLIMESHKRAVIFKGIINKKKGEISEEAFFDAHSTIVDRYISGLRGILRALQTIRLASPPKNPD
jgi:hypothetical protein